MRTPKEAVAGKKPKAYADNFKWKGPPKARGVEGLSEASLEASPAVLSSLSTA